MLPSFRRHGDLLVAYLGPQRPRVLQLALLLSVSIGLQLANPQVVRYFIDTAQHGGPVDTPTVAAFLFLGVVLVQQLAAVAAAYLGASVGWQATNLLRADLMRHCLTLDLPFHKRHTPGEIIERIDGDVTLLANFFSQFTFNVLGNALLVLGILVILSRSSVWLGLGLSVYAVATVLALHAVQRRAVLRNAADRQASARQYGAIEERLVGTEDIRGVGAERYVLRTLLGIMQARLRTNRSAHLAATLSYFTTNFLYVMAYAMGLGLGAFLYTRHQVTLGSVYVIVFYIGMLAAPLDSIRRQIQEMQRATAGIARIDAFLQTRSALPQSGTQTVPAGPLAVDVEHVTFRYEEGGSVLHDIHFSLPPGETLGLLGRTGSGKTSLTRLLARLYDPSSGRICLDGTPLPDIRMDDLRRRVGVVTQDVQFFRASVRDNLTFFQRGDGVSVRDREILRVFRDLDLWEWYETLPNGLDTLLGPGGEGLSSGQSQLLAFARVFLRDPGLVILDEATSRLDPATERFVEQAIDRLLAGRSGVVVAHRLRTVGRLDRIMVLEEGRVVEEGRRVALAADPRSRLHGLLRVGLEEVLV